VFRFGGLAVADDKRDAPRPFDVRTIEYLLKLMSEHDLSEIALQEGDQRIRLRKSGTAAPVYYPTPASVAPSAAPPVAHAPSAPNTPAPPQPAAPAKNLVEIKSPMVGTFYSKPDPKKPDFVNVGSKVTPKTVVCTIEAMKLYNEVHADCSGTIAEICVKSGDYVEFDTVLFRVDPS
jgi:acetyl-CoA carboxylase biotin carboxyl carrier protein